MKKFLTLLIFFTCSWAASHAQMTVQTTYVKDSFDYVQTSIGEHIFETQIRGIGVASRQNGSPWLAGFLIGDYSNDYGTNAFRWQTQWGVFNPDYNITANINCRFNDRDNIAWIKGLMVDSPGNNLSSFEMKSGQGMAFQINGCSYELPRDCNEGNLYNDGSNTQLTFRPTYADSLTIYTSIPAALGATIFCTDCTADGNTGFLLVGNGGIWIRQKRY